MPQERPVDSDRGMSRPPDAGGPEAERGKAVRLARLWDLFHRKERPAVVSRQPAAPSVVLSCERCGFDYTITRIEVNGRSGVVWSCECGSEFLPPGGPESFNLVRP